MAAALVLAAVLVGAPDDKPTAAEEPSYERFETALGDYREQVTDQLVWSLSAWLAKAAPEVRDRARQRCASLANRIVNARDWSLHLTHERKATLRAVLTRARTGPDPYREALIVGRRREGPTRLTIESPRPMWARFNGDRRVLSVAPRPSFHFRQIVLHHKERVRTRGPRTWTLSKTALGWEIPWIESVPIATDHELAPLLSGGDPLPMHISFPTVIRLMASPRPQAPTKKPKRIPSGH